MGSKILTTGQAARVCSVTPDTILKWIRSGRLPARRTAGGHHRIDRRDLEQLLESPEPGEVPRPRDDNDRHFRYCWEYNGNGQLLDGCKECVVFELRAQRCYEVVKLAPEVGHNMVFCKGSCEDCDYYKHVHAHPTNVLVVTDDQKLTSALELHAESAGFNLKVTDCEYTTSAAVESFRPDFAVVDCSLGQQTTRDITNHLFQDPRIPFVRVILAADDGRYPRECEKQVFARIEKPFNIKDIAECIDGIREAKFG